MTIHEWLSGFDLPGQKLDRILNSSKELKSLTVGLGLALYHLARLVVREFGISKGSNSEPILLIARNLSFESLPASLESDPF